MQNLLVVDTSSARSVLAVKTEEKFIDRTETRKSAHSRDILCRLQNIILEAGIELSDLDCIIFGCGPGSYTGIRITVGVVQGLSYGLDIPVVSVSSLEALAYSSIEENFDSFKEGNKILVSILARANEYFLGDALASETTSSNFFQSGGHGTASAIQLRGMPKRYSTVYIDGVKMSDPSSVSNDFDFNNL